MLSKPSVTQESSLLRIGPGLGPQGHQPALSEALWTWLLKDAELGSATPIVTLGGRIKLLSLSLLIRP